MNRAFADTYYFLALVSSKDAGHERAVEFAGRTDLEILTTAWVLAEFIDGLSAPSRRATALTLIDHLRGSSRVTILPPTWMQFTRGLELFSKRLDKGWTLTDCISFLIMEEESVGAALTADHHFEQAGFRLLLG